MMTSFQKSMHRFSLRFLDSKLEELYQKKCELSKNMELMKKVLVFGFLAVHFLIAIILIVTVILAYQGFNHVFKPEIELVTMILFFLSFLLEIPFFFCKKIKFFRGFCYTILSFIYISIYQNAYIKTGEDGIPLISILAIVCMQLFSIAYTKNWISSSASYFVGNLIFILCSSLTGKMPILQIIGLSLTCLGVLFICSLIYFFFDYQARKEFYGLYTAKLERKGLKKLFEEMPAPFLLVNNHKIYLANDPLKRLLQIEMNGNGESSSKEKNEEISYKLKALKSEKEEKTFWDYIIEDQSIEELSKNYFKILINDEMNYIEIKAAKVFIGKVEMSSYFFNNISEKDLMRKKIERKFQHILIASFSHEIRTPIVGGSSMTNELLNIIKEKPIVKKLKIIDIAFKKLNYFIGILHNYSLIQASNFLPFLENFEFKPAITEIVNIFKTEIKTKKLQFQLTFGRCLDFIYSDRIRLQQILFIVFSNSCKYTYEGSIKLKLFTDDSLIHAELEDTGCGIEESRLPNLFVMYNDNSNLSSLNPQGIGMALYVAKNAATLLGGNLEVLSVKGKGTTVKFSIKYENCQGATSRSLLVDLNQGNDISNLEIENTQRQIVESKSTSNNRFLIVDDDATCLLILRSFFKSFNLIPDEAMNGQQAIEKVEETVKGSGKNYSLIFMDINMPILDGEKATYELKERIKKGELPDCKIIALTAAQIQSKEHEQQFKNIGFDEIIQKPISKKKFDHVVKTFI